MVGLKITFLLLLSYTYTVWDWYVCPWNVRVRSTGSSFSIPNAAYLLTSFSSPPLETGHSYQSQTVLKMSPDSSCFGHEKVELMLVMHI
jgi:hypothetical protein